MPLTSLSRVQDRDFPPNAFDVRGWKVRTAIDDEGVGRVDDMLLDESGELRFLDVDLGVFKKRVLLPIRYARVDRSDDIVWVDGMVKEQFETIPDYDGDPDTAAPGFVRGVEDGYRTAIRQEHIDDRDRPGQLVRLNDLEDFRVAKGDSDPRGWTVVGADGIAIGEVDELIVDTGSMEAKYLDCDVEEDKLELEPIDRHVLIPVEYARLDRDKKNVVVDGLASHGVADYPIYAGLPVTEDVHRTMSRALSRAAPEEAPSRRVEREQEAPSRRVEHERVTEPEEVSRRQRTVDRESERFYRARHDASDSQTSTLRAGDQEVRIRLAGDDIIIEKRPHHEEGR